MPEAFTYHEKRTAPGARLSADQLTSPMSMASGGFATLWRAGSHGQYAIKCFNNGGMAAATEEFEAMCKLSGNSSVPKIYGLGTFVDGMEQGHAAIVEEYVDGFTLANVLKRGLITGSAKNPTLDTDSVVAIGLELAKALEQLERGGVSHRDLSANNVMLRRECVEQRLNDGVRLTLIDFGQSTLVTRPSVTPSFRARLATVPYGAPEMYGGEYWESRNSSKCDIWSFGSILVTMLVGEYWPDEISDLTTGISSPEDLTRITRAKRTPVDLTELMRMTGKSIGDTEKRLAYLVRKCTQYDPSLRPTATEIVRALENIAPGNTPRTPKKPLEVKRPQEKQARQRKQVNTVDFRPKHAVTPVPRQAYQGDSPRSSDFRIEGGTLIRYVGNQSEVAIPEGISSIGAHAFRGATFLERVLLPDSVRVIGDYAFEGCTSLRGMAIASVSRLGVGAFWGCSSLVSMVVREPVTDIPWYLFRECTSLEWVQLPSTIRSIGRESFAGCTSLSRIEIPPSVTAIGERAFFGCSLLGRVSVPPTVTDLAEDAFVTDNASSGKHKRGLAAKVVIAVILAVVVFSLAMLSCRKGNAAELDSGDNELTFECPTLVNDAGSTTFLNLWYGGIGDGKVVGTYSLGSGELDN